MQFNIVSYIMGKNDGQKDVTIETEDLVFTDTGNGNIVVTERS